MAEFLSHSNPLRRLMRRWNIASLRSGGGQIREVASWLSPGITVDRDWGDDDRHLWGYTADYSLPAWGFPAVAIFSMRREVLVRKIDFYSIDSTTGYAHGLDEVCLLSPPDAYNPVANDPGEYFPFFQTPPGPVNTLSVPACHVVSGYQTNLMTVTIGGVVVFPAIGPRYTNDWIPYTPYATAPTSWRKTRTILDWDDPPIIVPPYRIFAVQNIIQWATGVTLFVNLYISEREV